MNMKRNFLKVWAVAVAALAIVSCVETKVDEGGGIFVPEDYVPLEVTLSSGEKGSATTAEEPETRMMVGEITSSKVYYHWDEQDAVGALLLNIPTAAGNHEAVGERREENHNSARFDFEAMVPQEYSDTELLHTFVYYPYNPSLVQAVANKKGGDYLEEGVTFRIPSVQMQMNDELGQAECTKAMSRYAVAYDFAVCDEEQSNFNLQHQTAYFRFKVVGDSDYNNDNYRLKRVTVQVGKREEYTDIDGENRYKMIDKVNLSGSFTLGLDYNEATFDGSEQLQLFSAGGSTYVKAEFEEAQPLSEAQYAFIALSPDALWNPEANADRFMEIKLDVEAKQIVTNGNDEEQEQIMILSCTRYIPLAGRSVERGSLYDVQVAFALPLDTYTALDAGERANTYIIPAGGNYTFSVETPGNGVLPYDASWSDLASEGISEKLIEEGKTYAVDWLWTSGTLFKTYHEYQVLRNCRFDPSNNSVSFNIAEWIPQEHKLGNMVLALYETDSEGNFKQIVWTWLLWFAQPEDHHFSFANTRPSVNINNSDWYIMDRNLGAEEAGLGINSVGLYYQMGRKDPFVGPSFRGTLTPSYDSSTSTVTVAENGDYETLWYNGNRQDSWFNTTVFGDDVASWQVGKTQSGDITPLHYPTHLFARTAEQMGSKANKYAWVHDADQAATQTKTLFDPCPPGYKLPTTREWDNLKNSRYEFTYPPATGNGPLGYVHYHYNNPWAYVAYTDSPWTWPAGDDIGTQYTYYAYGEVKLRCDAGEYYEVDYELGSESNGTMGRRYHTASQSAYGMEEVNLPATGVLTQEGEWQKLATNITLWSSGRIDEVYDTFDGYWFGIKGNSDTNYANNYQEWWGEWNNKIWSFYTPSLFTNPFGAASAGLEQPTLLYDSAGNVSGLSTTANYAAPVRCIRTYNSTANAME